MKNLLYITIAGILAACGNGSEQKMAEETADLIRLTPDQLAYNKIETGPLPKGPLYHKVKATGRVDIPPNYSVKLSVPTAAYIFRINVLPGQRVKRGQVVAQLQHPSIADIQKAYLTTRAALDFLRKDLARKQGLVEGSAVSAREYESLQRDEIAKAANLRAIEAELERLGIDAGKLNGETVTQYLDVRAPIGGVVTDLYGQTGQFAGPDDPLLAIMSREHEHVELVVFQEDLVKVKKGMEVWMRLPGQDQHYTGAVFLANTQLDRETLASRVHVHTGDDFPELPIGAVVFGEIIYQVDSSYLLPKSEVVREGAASFIFIRTDQGFKKQQVEIGYDDGQNVGITGPEEVLDAQVVVQGNYYLNGV